MGTSIGVGIAVFVRSMQAVPASPAVPSRGAWLGLGRDGVGSAAGQRAGGRPAPPPRLRVAGPEQGYGFVHGHRHGGDGHHRQNAGEEVEFEGFRGHGVTRGEQYVPYVANSSVKVTGNRSGKPREGNRLASCIIFKESGPNSLILCPTGHFLDAKLRNWDLTPLKIIQLAARPPVGSVRGGDKVSTIASIRTSCRLLLTGCSATGAAFSASSDPPWGRQRAGASGGWG